METVVIVIHLMVVLALVLVVLLQRSEGGALGMGGGGGGGGGGRIALGGGAGLLITIVALFFGVNPGDLLGAGGPTPGTSSDAAQIQQQLDECTYEMANENTICRIKATTVSVDTGVVPAAPRAGGRTAE